MKHDLNKYLDAARAQCEVNRAKWGKQSEEVLYCVLTEQWGQFVRAVNRWRFPSRGGNIVEVQDAAVKALAVLHDMGHLYELDSDDRSYFWSWLALFSDGNYCMATNNYSRCERDIAAMLVKALNEDASGVKS